MSDEPRNPRGPNDPRDMRRIGDPRDYRADKDPIDKPGRLDPPDPMETLTVHVADAMLDNAASNEALAAAVRGITTDQSRTKKLVIIGVSLIGIGCVMLAALAAIVVWYIIPISNTNKAGLNLLVDCDTPSKPGAVHLCSDSQTRSGFNLTTAEVRCAVNMARLNRDVHTDEVRQCVADTLGVTLDPTVPLTKP